jgi:hypothetical protein
MLTASFRGAPALDPRSLSSDVYAALCVWEELLSLRDRHDAPAGLSNLWTTKGTHWMRASAFEIGRFANAIWDALDEASRDRLSPFDWEFIPALLGAIDFEDFLITAPSIETAIAAMRTKAAPPPAEYAALAATRIEGLDQ